MSSVHLRKYASKMFPSARLEGFGLQRTAIRSNFKVKCEGLDRIWVWMGNDVEQSLSWAWNNGATSVMVQCQADCIKEGAENQRL